MRAVLLYLLAIAIAVGVIPSMQPTDGCCPCAEEQATTDTDDGIDCCLPGPHQCACGVLLLAALPELPELQSGPAPACATAWTATPPDALRAQPRPPPPTPPPIG